MIKVPEEFDVVEYKQWALDNIFPAIKTKINNYTDDSKNLASRKKEIKEHNKTSSRKKKLQKPTVKISDSLKSYLSAPENIEMLIVGVSDDLKNKIQASEPSFKEFYRYLTENLYEYIRRYFGKEICQRYCFRACPYCNRSFVFGVKKISGNNIATFQLDHIYPKSKYPYLAINIFNLIPVCSTCNQTKSHTQLMNPFEESWIDSDIKFKWKYSKHLKIRTALIPDGEDFEIYIKNKESLGDSIKTLGLEEIYNEHKVEALEIIRLAQKYNKTYIEELSNKYKGLNLDEYKIKRDLLGPNLDSKDHHKRPLAKFTRDIAEDVGFFDVGESLGS